MSVWAGIVGAADLASLRRERRGALAAKAQSGVTQHFRLLVIPVDFADAPFAAGWDAAEVSRGLAGEEETLEGWVRAASQGRMELVTVLAPPVYLPGTRRDYSDIDLNGFTRTRRLAREALEATAAALPLRLADGDGPDGRIATDDDDGEVDGVLILHAAPGLENDLEDGLIVPLQYWLEEPVVDRGTAARFYAVASLHSRLGVWIHETCHLFGLEDRYDPYITPPESDPLADAGWGGLGRFSLMAAGHVDADGASLLDAYSALELGWADVAPIVAAGDDDDDRGALVRRRDVPGTDGREYFLLQFRSPDAAPPWDAGLAGPRLVALHVDETVPDGRRDGHLRVRLVEADGGDGVASGAGLGDDADLFGAPGGPTVWDATSEPSTLGYAGPSHLQVGEFMEIVDAEGSYLHAAWDVTDLRLSIDPMLTVADGDTLFDVVVHVASGEAPVSVSLEIDGSDSGGRFAGGVLIVENLVADPDGRAWRLAAPLPWTPDPAPGDVPFAFTLDAVPFGGSATTLIWTHGWDPSPTDIFPVAAPGWPAGWTAGTSDPDRTVWTFWNAGLGGEIISTPTLACVAPDVDPADWPDVSYGNGAEAWLLSPPLRAEQGRALALVHHLDVFSPLPGTAPDGAVVEAVLPDGATVPLTPLGGYPGVVASDAQVALMGTPAFVGAGELDPDHVPVWDLDVFDLSELPDGDLRLKFRFAADPAWRGRGWFIRSVRWLDDESEVPGPDVGFAARRAGDAWTRPALLGDQTAWLEVRSGDAADWRTVAMVDPGVSEASDAVVAAAVAGEAVDWHRVRWRIIADDRPLRTRSALRRAAATPEGTDLFGLWPNPARGGTDVRIALSPEAISGTVHLYDLRGRRLRTWDVGPGHRVVAWDGRDADGRRCPAGRYLISLEPGASGAARSVTLLP